MPGSSTSRLDRPVLITGTPRSGKSCIAKILKDAPEFAYCNEPLTLWEVGMGRRGDDSRSPDEARDQVRGRIRAACENAVISAGKERYLDDLSYHALRIEFVHRVLPEARIIHVIRDGLAAIPEMIYGWTFRDSLNAAISRRHRGLRVEALPRHAWRFLLNYVRSRAAGKRLTWGPRVPGIAEVVKQCSAAETAAFQWEQMVRIAMDALSRLPGDHWIEVRHDRLVTNPRAEMTRIAEFCEVRDPLALAESAETFIDPKFVFEKRVEPTPAEWKAILDRVEPLRRWLGYSEAPWNTQAEST